MSILVFGKTGQLALELARELTRELALQGDFTAWGGISRICPILRPAPP